MKTNNIQNTTFPFVACLALALVLYPNSVIHQDQYSTEGMDLQFTLPDLGTQEKEESITSFEREEKWLLPLLRKDFDGFKEALAFKESTGNYFSINTLGYLGKYQFGEETLELLGVYNTDLFLQNPKIQEKTFIANMQRNKWILRKYIREYKGQVINGILITESGLLAAAHLAGPGNVIDFLKSSGTRSDFADNYGSHLSTYMKMFQGYDMSHVKPVKNPRISF